MVTSLGANLFLQGDPCTQGEAFLWTQLGN